MAQRDIHATALALIDGRRRVQARVVLAGGQSLLHAGRVVQPLGLAVAIPRPLATIHAVLRAAGHRVAAHPGMRHLVHVSHAVVHHGEQRQSSMKEVKKKLQECQRKTKEKEADSSKMIKGEMKEKSSHVKERLASSVREVNPYAVSSRVSTGQSAPPATTRPNWRAELYDDAEL